MSHGADAAPEQSPLDCHPRTISSFVSLTTALSSHIEPTCSPPSENTSPLSSTSSSNSDDSVQTNPQVLQMFNPRMPLSCYPTHQGTGTVSFISLLDLRVSSFHDLAFWSTDTSLDGINSKMYATSTSVAHA